MAMLCLGVYYWEKKTYSYCRLRSLGPRCWLDGQEHAYFTTWRTHLLQHLLGRYVWSIMVPLDPKSVFLFSYKVSKCGIVFALKPWCQSTTLNCWTANQHFSNNKINRIKKQFKWNSAARWFWDAVKSHWCLIWFMQLMLPFNQEAN